MEGCRARKTTRCRAMFVHRRGCVCYTPLNCSLFFYHTKARLLFLQHCSSLLLLLVFFFFFAVCFVRFIVVVHLFLFFSVFLFFFQSHNRDTAESFLLSRWRPKQTNKALLLRALIFIRFCNSPVSFSVSLYWGINGASAVRPRPSFFLAFYYFISGSACSPGFLFIILGCSFCAVAHLPPSLSFSQTNKAKTNNKRAPLLPPCPRSHSTRSKVFPPSPLPLISVLEASFSLRKGNKQKKKEKRTKRNIHAQRKKEKSDDAPPCSYWFPPPYSARSACLGLILLWLVPRQTGV